MKAMGYGLFITQVLQEASVVARSHFGKVSGVTKPDDNNQVLTEADTQIGRLIVTAIQKAFPDHNIVDEETGVVNNNSPYTWVVDPIDGTSNFAQGIPLYGSMLGLLSDGAPIAGGIALPAFNEICIAEKGQGSWCNEERLRVSSETRLLSALVAYGIDGHQEDPDLTKRECDFLAKLILNIRNLRSSNSVFDAVLVAKGKYSGYLNRTGRIWDNVAPQIVIEEAGGIYTDFHGAAIDYSHPLSKVNANFTFCSASPGLHKQLQHIIHSEHKT